MDVQFRDQVLVMELGSQLGSQLFVGQKKMCRPEGRIDSSGTEEEEDKNQGIISTGCMITYIEPGVDTWQASRLPLPQ